MNFKHWEWCKEKKVEENEVTCHSLIAGDVLCRYWGDAPKSKEAELIENAKKNKEDLDLAVEIIDDLISAIDVMPISWQEFVGEELAEKINNLLENKVY